MSELAHLWPKVIDRLSVGGLDACWNWQGKMAAELHAQVKAWRTMGDHCLSGGQRFTRDPDATESSRGRCPHYSVLA